MPQRQINATAASLLGFLHAGPMSGWDLATTAQTVIGDFWSLTQSQVYRELSAMAASGLVEAGAPGRRERRPYTITSQGRAAFEAWISEEPSEETIRFPLLLTVGFGRHLDPGLLARFVEAHRRTHEERLADYQRQFDALSRSTSSDVHLLATLDFGIRYEQAVLSWFDTLPATLGLPSADMREQA